MVTREEIEKVIAFCENAKKEKQRAYCIERNPFRDEIPWMYRFPLIEVDRPKEVAAKTSVVYDSTTRTLWQFLNMDWRRINPDVI